jgi:tRNA A-37 threonylcarbamoyl transferase component Bud32
MPRMTGRVIAGRYALSVPIGRGAMGVVWRAHDQLLDREVAVKEVVLSAAIGEDEQRNAYQRTLREARTAARLSHRGVVTIYDVAEEEGRPFIVMELVPSQSLDQVVAAEGPMTPLRAGRMGQQLLAALATAHAAGVLHRDVKPSNVLIANDRSGGGWDERSVLTDFGIAQFEGDPRLTQTGMVMGSPGFTAPERIRGGDATPASDLWSLGATIYTAVEGSGPYEQRGGAITTMSAIINEDAPVAPSAGRLGPLIAALLRREPSARPTAAAAARMFTEVLPLLPDMSTHPATVRSAYVPVPAAPAASVFAGDVKESAPDSPDGEVAAAGAASADAVSAADAAVPVKAAAVDAVAVGAAAAVAASPAPEAASPAPEPSVSPAALVAEAAAGGAVMADAGASADSMLASAPAPTQRPVPLPPPLSLQPKPTFTASKGNQSAAPRVSASRPPSPASAAPAVAAQPAPLSSAGRPARPDPPTMPEPAQYYGRNPPHAPASGGPYAGGQFAGPSQDYPGLAQQYAPGTGGKPRRSRRGRRIALVVGAIVVAAAAGGGAALALNHENNAGASITNTSNGASLQNQPASVQALDTPSTTVPPGFTPVTVSASAAGTTAGFSIDVPSSWTETRDGLITKFKDDNGDRFLEVDLTAHTYPNMVTDAEYVEKQQVAVGTFPGYKQAALKAVPVRGSSGAFWQFTWDRNGVTTRTDDILFMAQTPNGQQSYAIYFRAPNSGWGSKFLPQFEKMLSTFQVAAS